MPKKPITVFLLIFFIAVGLFLRLRWWPDCLSFGFEQANDAISSSNIYLQKNLTLLGPMTEVEGIFHSPIYYYIIGLIYFLFGKNPAWVSLFIILENLTCIPLIYFVGEKIFNKKVGLISAAIFAISYEVISYSLWIANASLALPLIILTLYFFYRSFKENQKYLPLAFFIFSLAVCFELVVFINIFSLATLYFIYHREKIRPKNFLLSITAFVIPLITYPFFEIKNKFLMISNLLKMLNGQDAEFKSIFGYLFYYLEGLAKEFANLFFPIHGFIAGVIMIVLFVYLASKLKRKNYSKNPWFFILIWLLATLPTFLFKVLITNSEYAFIGINAPACLLMATFIYELLTKKRTFLTALLIFLVLAANLRAWNGYLGNPGRKLFDSQRGVILKDTLAVVDYTYVQSAGKQFYVNSVTRPLFVSKLWDYLYSWHGQEKYGYLPSDNNQSPLQYLIIESGGDDSTFEIYKQRMIDELNTKSAVEEKKQFGLITVEKRRFFGHNTDIPRLNP